MQSLHKGLPTKRSRNNAGRSREAGQTGHLVDANTTGNFNVAAKQQVAAYESYAQWNKDENKRTENQLNALQFPEIS